MCCGSSRNNPLLNIGGTQLTPSKHHIQHSIAALAVQRGSQIHAVSSMTTHQVVGTTRHYSNKALSQRNLDLEKELLHMLLRSQHPNKTEGAKHPATKGLGPFRAQTGGRSKHACMGSVFPSNESYRSNRMGN